MLATHFQALRDYGQSYYAFQRLFDIEEEFCNVTTDINQRKAHYNNMVRISENMTNLYFKFRIVSPQEMLSLKLKLFQIASKLNEHPLQLVSHLNTLALIYKELKDRNNEKKTLRNIIKLLNKIPNDGTRIPNYDKLSDAFHQLGVAYIETNLVKKSEEVLLKALELREILMKKYSENPFLMVDHPVVSANELALAKILQSLATLYQKTKNLQNLRNILLRELDILEKRKDSLQFLDRLADINQQLKELGNEGTLSSSSSPPPSSSPLPSSSSLTSE